MSFWPGGEGNRCHGSVLVSALSTVGSRWRFDPCPCLLKAARWLWEGPAVEEALACGGRLFTAQCHPLRALMGRSCARCFFCTCHPFHPHCRFLRCSPEEVKYIPTVQARKQVFQGTQVWSWYLVFWLVTGIGFELFCLSFQISALAKRNVWTDINVSL